MRLLACLQHCGSFIEFLWQSSGYVSATLLSMAQLQERVLVPSCCVMMGRIIIQNPIQTKCQLTCNTLPTCTSVTSTLVHIGHVGPHRHCNLICCTHRVPSRQAAALQAMLVSVLRIQCYVPLPWGPGILVLILFFFFRLHLPAQTAGTQWLDTHVAMICSALLKFRISISCTPLLEYAMLLRGRKHEI